MIIKQLLFLPIGKLNLIKKKKLKKKTKLIKYNYNYNYSYDVIYTSNLEDIVSKFHKMNANIVFSAEKFCWPNHSLAIKYPNVEKSASKYLNSGAFMGYASYLWKLLRKPIENTDDDQLYYTNIYLDEKKRKEFNIKLDTKSEIFQNLNGAKDDVKLEVNLDDNQGILKNIYFQTTPNIIHGNGVSKIELNSFSNYLAKTFNQKCLICIEDRLELNVSFFCLFNF